jgi:murein DD-endopeptidase MepM/ murein hydrolase activator NlpD
MRYKEFRTDEIYHQLLRGFVNGGNSLGDFAFPNSKDDATKTPDDSAPAGVAGNNSTPTATISPQSFSSSGSEIKPVDGPVSSKFGYRTSVGKAHNHKGTDFAVPVGTPVKAPQSGTIQSAGTNGGHAGTFVILNAGGTTHKFFHLSKLLVKTGDTVKQGQTVALSGNTGNSTGPHLHWEKHVAGLPIDPMANVG